MTAHEQRPFPALGDWLRGKQHRIGRAKCRPIDQKLPTRFRSRSARDEIDDAAKRAGTVQRRRHALDDLDAAKVGRWNLEEAKPPDLLAKQR